MATKHEFAIYVPELSKYLKQDKLVLQDPEVVLRVSSVLRLQLGEICLLFDRTMHVRCLIKAVQKKTIEFQILFQQQNIVLKPQITCLLPLLKRDDLEVALYSAVELGANFVQLVLTEKVQRAWGGTKEFERLQRIMIAAAEQSKNFAIPELHAPLRLQEALRVVV